MTNTVTNILSRDEELALRKPIEDYVGKIQAEIDELREEGTNKVLEYSEEIEVLKRDKIYTKSEKEARLSELNTKLQKAKEIEAQNKQPINEKIAQAEKYLKDHYQTDYYNKVVESNKYEVQKAKSDYDKKLKDLEKEHKDILSGLSDKEEIKEENFITRNHVTEGDFVTVRLTVPVKETAVTDAEAEARRKAETERLEAEKRAEQERLAEEQHKAEEARLAAEKAEAEKAAQQNTLADTPSETKITTDYHLSLRANLLRWATLTPDLGVEWRICPSWGIAVNGSWTSWTWSDKDRRYALWEVAPEVRYYMGEKKAWYLGALFKAGQFNYKLSETGKQGDLMGGGITAGHQLRLNKALALDFNLGLGYLNADYEKYEVIDGVRVRHGNETKDWWGPINAGVTLVWKLF